MSAKPQKKLFQIDSYQIDIISEKFDISCNVIIEKE